MDGNEKKVSPCGPEDTVVFPKRRLGAQNGKNNPLKGENMENINTRFICGETHKETGQRLRVKKNCVRNDRYAFPRSQEQVAGRKTLTN